MNIIFFVILCFVLVDTMLRWRHPEDYAPKVENRRRGRRHWYDN